MRLLLALAITLILAQFSALAGPDSATPTPFFLHYGIIVAHGDTVNFYNVPTTGSNFQTYDIECHLALNPDGTLYVGSSKVTPTPTLPPSVDQFLPGEYHCVSGVTGTIIVNGPALAQGGRHVWTYNIVGTPSFGPYVNYGGSWTTGPARDNPQLLGIAPDSVLPKGFTFGRSGDNVGDAIAVQQIGDRLIIAALKSTTKDDAPTVYSVDAGYSIFQRKPASSTDSSH